MKTADMTGAALDWAVSKCEEATVEIGKRGQVIFDTYQDDPPAGVNEYNDSRWQTYSPSTNWEQGGPIIEREKIEPRHVGNTFGWRAFLKFNNDPVICYSGPTFLVAAMRCYVASRLGDDVEIPAELVPS